MIDDDERGLVDPNDDEWSDDYRDEIDEYDNRDVEGEENYGDDYW